MLGVFEGRMMKGRLWISDRDCEEGFFSDSPKGLRFYDAYERLTRVGEDGHIAETESEIDLRRAFYCVAHPSLYGNSSDRDSNPRT